MAKIFSTRYNAGAFNTGLFILRVAAGVLMAQHGYDKLTHFDMAKANMINFLNFSQSVSLYLVIFAELICAVLVALGLFTRFACVPLIISCAIALWKVHGWDAWKGGQLITLYLAIFIAILFTGPGRASVDSMISK